MRGVDCFGILYGNQRRLDSVLPPLPKHSWKSTSREQTFGRSVSMSSVDNFGLLYGNRRRLDTVLPPLSCHSKILSLMPPKASSSTPSNPEQCGELRLPSKLRAFVSRVKKALSAKPQPQRLPEILPGDAKPAPEKVVKPQELCSKGPLAGMLSEQLVVIQIIRSNHQQQHGSSEPLLLQQRFKTLSSSSKVAVFPIFKEFKSDGKKCENKKTSTLDEPVVHELEIIETHKESGEVNRSALNEVNGGDTADDSKRDGQKYSTCSLSEADISTSGQIVGGGTKNDSDEDGKECSDSSESYALPKEESAASQIENSHTANESEGDKRDCGDSSRFDALSNESAVSHTGNGIIANESEEDAREGSDLSKSAASSGKKLVDCRSEDGGTEDKNDRKGADNSDCSTPNVLSVKESTVSQSINGDGSANGIKGKARDCGDSPVSDALPSKGTLHKVEAVHTAGKEDGDRKAYREPSNIDAFSETSSDDESDGGVPVRHCQEGRADGSNRSTPDKLSNEDNAHQGDDDDTVDDPKKERKDSADSSTSDYVTTDENLQAEDVCDEIEVNVEGNRIDDDSRSMPSEDRESDETKVEVDGAGGDSVATSSDTENVILSVLPSSSTGLQYGSNQSEIALYHNEDTRHSHESRSSNSDSSVDEGPWVMGVDHRGDIQAHHVSPVPFNVRQYRDSKRSPSIESGESELDDTSPLVQKTSAPINRPARPEHASPSTSEDVGGLLKIKASLNVWRDGSGNANSGGKPTLRRKPGMVFKDVSNTRQLFRNFQNPAVNQDPVKENKVADQTQKNAQHIPYLHNSVPYLQPPLKTLHTGLRQHGDDSGEHIWAPARDSVRAAHFTASLAALEGRVFPMPGTPKPLIRCVRQEYGPDVLLDWPAPSLFHPKPTRLWISEKAVTSIEKQIASADRMGASTVTGPRIGPDNPVPALYRPVSGLFRVKKTHHLSYKQKDENLAKQAASPAWTSSSVETKPQISRPRNPTPDATRYRHMDRC